MRAEAENAWLVAIAVGFETEIQFVFSSRRHPLEEPDRQVKNGGYPVGLLRFDNENPAVQGSCRPFPEYANEGWVKTYLTGLPDKTDGIPELSRDRVYGSPKAY